MGIIMKMKAGWKAMDSKERAKLVINMITALGGGTIGSAIFAHCRPMTSSKLENMALFVTSYGVGCAIGEASGKAIGDLIDDTCTIGMMIQESRKEAKANG